MNRETLIVQQLHDINERITAACLKSGRQVKEVKLLLATKTVSADIIKIALTQGETLIAENKVQELKEKYEALKDVPHTNHFIGHLQTNKIKDILKYDVSCIQSIDRLDLAEKLHQRLSVSNKTMDILVQVNTSGEESKFGVHPDEALALVKKIARFNTLQVKGLMTIGLFSADAEQVRPCFQLLRSLQKDIITHQIPGVSMDELSMGMSGDLEIAIEEGATIVRVGTAVFGQRPTPDNFYWNERSNAG